MRNHKRSFLASAEEDRISKLSEDLINSILERLPVQDAARTSILSKEWRYRWTTMRALVFDRQFSQKFAKNGAFGRNGFIRIINQLVFLHKGPILKFSLHIPTMYLDSFQEIDQWMLFLSRNNVRELVLTNSNRPYELPSYVFSCLELRKLNLTNCIFKPPLEFEGFPKLVQLFLENVDFRANSCGTLVTLPQLKKLQLWYCTNVYNFNIVARTLQLLIVIACPDALLLRLLDSPCLIEDVRIYFLKPIEDFARVGRMNLARLLSNFPKINSFSIDGHFLKELQVMHYDVGAASNHLESPDCLDHTLDQLQTVEIYTFGGSRLELLFIKLLLAHSPSLQKMTIAPSETCDVHKRLDIAKDVMWFSRASPKAEMIYKP